ncbi:MAG TPA: hypothetical protein PLC35_05615 [Methanosarcina vacuolata]|nr:hypothetical protein [Methanosarcina sp. DH1]MDY0129682.1 hypothetical protein [Methanosarcina vacuolata]HPS89434.1 hypothetical protein [Methanosarcina vacuolata]
MISYLLNLQAEYFR